MGNEAMEPKLRHWIEPQRTQRPQKWGEAVMIAEKKAFTWPDERKANSKNSVSPFFYEVFVFLAV
jgi:hypothetical protein